jgi:hypothetical protein
MNSCSKNKKLGSKGFTRLLVDTMKRFGVFGTLKGGVAMLVYRTNSLSST